MLRLENPPLAAKRAGLRPTPRQTIYLRYLIVDQIMIRDVLLHSPHPEPSAVAEL